MSLMVGVSRGGPFRRMAELVIIGALVGAVLNSKDIQRYLKIRGM